jgi:DNA-binding MurR/RpiR family transcriptional regulator
MDVTDTTGSSGDPGLPPRPTGSLQERIGAKLATMTRAERRVAEYLRNHIHEVVFATAGQIGAASRTSDATVVRTARTLGYTGLIELKYSLGQQVIHGTAPAVRVRNRIEHVGSSTPDMLAHVFTEANERLSETWRLVPQERFEAAVDLIAGAREVFSIGFGPSEPVAMYLALRLNRMGRYARWSGATGFRMADDLLRVRTGDAIVLYAPGRLLDEIGILLDHADAVAARSVLITDSLGAILRDRVDVVLPAVHSPSGLTGEALCAQVLSDALLLAVAKRDHGRSTATSEALTALRSKLIGADSADPVRSRDRRTAEPRPVRAGDGPRNASPSHAVRRPSRRSGPPTPRPAA